MALFGQGVADMFKDVVPQASASERFGENAIDWAQVKPFQVINPMGSWAATNTGATAPTPPTQATTPQSEYQKWLAQQSGMKNNSDGSHDYANRETPWGDVLGMPELNGKTFMELTPAQQVQAQGIVDPLGIGNVISKAMLGSPLGQGATAIGGLFDSLLGRGVTPTSTPGEIANAYAPPSWGNLSTTPVTPANTAPVGAGIPANPMGLDPAQQGAAGGGGTSFGGFGSAAEQGGAGVAEANGGFSYGDSSQGYWG